MSNAVALGSGATSALLQAKAAELQAATSSAAAAPVSNEVPQPRDASFSFLSTSTSGIPQPVRSARRADSTVTIAQAPPSTSALAHSMRAEEPDTNDSRSTLSGNPAAALAPRTASAPACETNERAEPTDMHSSMRAMYNVAPDRDGGSADADHAARRGAESSAQGASDTPAYNSPSRLPVHRRRVGAHAPVVQPAAEAELSSRSVYYPAPGSRRHSWDEPPAQAAPAPSSALPSFSAAAAEAADGGGMPHAWSAQHLHSMGDGAASASERGVDRSSASPAPALPPAPGCDAALPSASAMIITPSTHNAPAPSAPSALDVSSALPPNEPVAAGHMPRAGMASSAAWTTTHMAPRTGTTDAVVAQTLVQHVDDVSRAMLEGIAALSARLDALQNAATAVRTAQPHASSSSSSVPVQLPPAAPYLSFMPSPMRMVGLPPSVMPAATAAPLPGSNEAAVAVSATAAAAAAPGASKPAPYAPAFGMSSVGMDARPEQGSAGASSQQLPALVAAYPSPSFPASAASSRRSSVGTDSLSAHAPPSLRMDMPDFVAALAARAAQTDQLLARAAVQLGSSAASSAGLGAGST
ncbi:MAG: hypothetical protein EOO41_00405 [Methanobacteriota archaeon]|nr:MAG: hypothetical protein EOO41_00405 [Euryarchaeota archaeon]